MWSRLKRSKSGRGSSAAHNPQRDLKGIPQLPNSCVMRIMEETGAEREADKLSAGVASTTPDAVREEMGSRMGADFSGVRFHDDAASISRSRSMGARAWARGSDVYFGRGGFDPSVAAHELVHTVQQGAVQGNASWSVPSDVVQLLPGDDEDLINKDSDGQKKKGGVDPLESAILASLSSDFGARCYRDFEKKLKDMIKKGAGKTVPAFTQQSGIHFMVEGANRIYTAKAILEEITQKPLESKDDAKERAKEYNAFISFLSGRLGDFGLEELAVEGELINRVPKYDHSRSTKNTRTKRAWELDNHSKDKEQERVFNPSNDPELEQIQDRIDRARNAKEAYSIFAAFTGNSKGSLKDSYSTIKNLDVTLLKKKLKHMARVVIDYPELRNSIGNMKTYPKTKTVTDPETNKKVKKDNKTIMGTDSTLGGRRKATIYYNAHMDRAGEAGENERSLMDFKARHNGFNAHRDYAGTHELGHVMASTLQDPENETEAILEQHYNLVEDKMLRSVINGPGWSKGLINFEQIGNLKYEQISTRSHDFKVLNPKASKLDQAGHTSKYGADSPAEFFAEAVSDVYAHGKDAKPMSIELVKEYENRQKEESKKRFFAEAHKPKPSLLERLWSFLKFW